MSDWVQNKVPNFNMFSWRSKPKKAITHGNGQGAHGYPGQEKALFRSGTVPVTRPNQSYHQDALKTAYGNMGGLPPGFNHKPVMNGEDHDQRKAQDADLENRIRRQMHIFKKEPAVTEEIFIEEEEEEEKEETLPASAAEPQTDVPVAQKKRKTNVIESDEDEQDNNSETRTSQSVKDRLSANFEKGMETNKPAKRGRPPKKRLQNNAEADKIKELAEKLKKQMKEKQQSETKEKPDQEDKLSVDGHHKKSDHEAKISGDGHQEVKDSAGDTNLAVNKEGKMATSKNEKDYDSNSRGGEKNENKTGTKKKEEDIHAGAQNQKQKTGARESPEVDLLKGANKMESSNLDAILTMQSEMLKPSGPGPSSSNELTDEMEEQIALWLRAQPSGQVLIDKFRLQITRQDVATLAGLNWLNDEIINFYMNLLEERGEQENKPKVYAFNTFFYPKITSGGQAAVKRWTRRIDVFAKDYILIPVHLDKHWCLAVVDFKKKQIQYYDSMGGNNVQCLNVIKKYLCDESLDKKKQEFNMQGWSSIVVKNIPQQMNLSDCGMFACKYAEYITREAPITFTQQHMPYFRRRMVYEIVTGKLLQ